MSTITETLTAEHALLNLLFDELGRLLPQVRTVAELRLLTRLVTGLLSHHADLEDNLAYAALDHALAEKGQLDRLYQDHHEIDQRFRAAAVAKELPEAVRLLQAGLKASREHFRLEERTVFPLLEQQLSPATLKTLGVMVSSNASPLGRHGFANALSARLRNTASRIEAHG